MNKVQKDKEANKVILVKDLKNDLGISEQVISELNENINSMISFASYNGIIINSEINVLIQNSNVDDLLEAYNLLCKNIYPATPKSIRFYRLMAEKWDNRNIFSRMPLTKNLFYISFVFLLSFILSSLSSKVNMHSLDKGILNNSGLSLLLNLLYLLSLSGLGVMFYLLRSINHSIRKGAVTPEDSAYFPVLIVLGLISGLIMSEVILYNVSINEGSSGLLMNKSLFALLGGFSSDAIFSILYNSINRIKQTFEFVKKKPESI